MHETTLQQRGRWMRELVESIALLIVIVLVSRAFLLEGYLISTGSMAPTLLGYHRQLKCPACHFRFTCGAAYDAPHARKNFVSAAPGVLSDPSQSTTCPNCSLSEIDPQVAPRNEGDQLLVHKLAYEFRDPRRWEIVVFQQPGEKSQAYVKRVVGLPDETVTLRHGDIHIDGVLQRKPFVVQQAMKVPVADYFSQPVDHDPDWRSRWVVDPHSRWRQNSRHLVYQAPPTDTLHTGPIDPSELDWLRYEHWIRTGGEQKTTVAIDRWPADLDVPDAPRLNYAAGKLTVVGTLSALEKNRWQRAVDDPVFQNAIESLYHESHLAPIVDSYSYNAGDGRRQYPIRDLLAELTVEKISGPGELIVELCDGTDSYHLRISPSVRMIELYGLNNRHRFWKVEYDSQLHDQAFNISFSTFDRQLLVTLNGTQIADAVRLTENGEWRPLIRPLKIGARDVELQISQLALFRDVYYTPKTNLDHNVSDALSYTMQPDEFFVLGDNSPVSVDSRMWDSPAVPRAALIGKPLVVHLPSRQKQLSWRGQVENVRVPDWSKMRIIH